MSLKINNNNTNQTPALPSPVFMYKQRCQLLMMNVLKTVKINPKWVFALLFFLLIHIYFSLFLGSLNLACFPQCCSLVIYHMSQLRGVGLLLWGPCGGRCGLVLVVSSLSASWVLLVLMSRMLAVFTLIRLAILRRSFCLLIYLWWLKGEHDQS